MESKMESIRITLDLNEDSRNDSPYTQKQFGGQSHKHKMIGRQQTFSVKKDTNFSSASFYNQISGASNSPLKSRVKNQLKKMNTALSKSTMPNVCEVYEDSKESRQMSEITSCSHDTSENSSQKDQKKVPHLPFLGSKIIGCKNPPRSPKSRGLSQWLNRSILKQQNNIDEYAPNYTILNAKTAMQQTIGTQCADLITNLKSKYARVVMDSDRSSLSAHKDTLKDAIDLLTSKLQGILKMEESDEAKTNFKQWRIENKADSGLSNHQNVKVLAEVKILLSKNYREFQKPIQICDYLIRKLQVPRDTGESKLPSIIQNKTFNDSSKPILSPKLQKISKILFGKTAKQGVEKPTKIEVRRYRKGLKNCKRVYKNDYLSSKPKRSTKLNGHKHITSVSPPQATDFMVGVGQVKFKHG